MSFIPLILKTEIVFPNNAYITVAAGKTSNVSTQFRFTFFDNSTTLLVTTITLIPAPPNPVTIAITIEDNVISLLANTGVQNSFQTIRQFFDVQFANANFFQVDGILDETNAVLNFNSMLNQPYQPPGPNIPFAKGQYTTIASIVILAILSVVVAGLFIAIVYFLMRIRSPS